MSMIKKTFSWDYLQVRVCPSFTEPCTTWYNAMNKCTVSVNRLLCLPSQKSQMKFLTDYTRRCTADCHISERTFGHTSGGRKQSLQTEEEIMSCHFKTCSVTKDRWGTQRATRRRGAFSYVSYSMARTVAGPDGPGFLPMGIGKMRIL